MRAVIYARYSTDAQSEASIADQLRVCREYAARHGWHVASEHSDEGISGAALGNRPGVLAALSSVQRGDVLLVTDLSRLSRSQDLAPLLSRLRHRGVRVLGVHDGYDSESRTARMQAGLSGIMSEEFRAMVADRTRSALEMRARERRATGGRAYGYDSQRRIVPAEAAIVREIFQRFAAGESMRQIATDLNLRGVPSPGYSWARRVRRKDGRWLVSGIHAILHNELYIGRIVWNRREWVKDPDTGKRVPRERPRSQWIVHEDSSLAIVDRQTWDRCHARLGQPGHGRIGPVRYLLSGLLECGVCGAKMVIYGGSTRRYGCGTFRGGGVHACSNSLSVRQDLAEELILAPIVDDLLSPQAVEEMVAFMRAELRREQIRPVSVAPDLARIDEQIRELERLVQLGALTPLIARAAIEQAERERRALLRAAERRDAAGVWTTEELAEAYREQARRLRSVLTGPDVHAAREALRELVGIVRLEPAEGYLVATYPRGVVPLLGLSTERTMVAGAGFEPATFGL